MSQRSALSACHINIAMEQWLIHIQRITDLKIAGVGWESNPFAKAGSP